MKKKNVICAMLILIFTAGIAVGAWQIYRQLHEYSEGVDSYTDLETYFSAWRYSESSLSSSLHCSQKHLQILTQDIGHPHLFRIRVQLVQILFRTGGIHLECCQKCFRSQFVAAANHIANGTL